MVTLEGNPQAETNHLATKVNVAKLRTDIVRSERSLTLWSVFVSLAFTVILASILVPIMFMILDRLPKHCGWG